MMLVSLNRLSDSFDNDTVDEEVEANTPTGVYRGPVHLLAGSEHWKNSGAAS